MNTRTIVLILVLIVIVGAIYYLEPHRPGSNSAVSVTIPSSASSTPERISSLNAKAEKYPAAPELVYPDGFINTKSFKLADLVGKKVILVDFWTYSCINCIRTIPYLNAWHDKYHDQGLEIVGIHSPEFDFEKVYDNVVSAVKKFDISYPVVQDNELATWNAYQNLYWPHKYLIDIDGFIVHEHAGEGSYGETEKKIQELLSERMKVLGEQGLITEDMAKPANPIDIDFSKVGSPEIYFGSSRNQYLANGTQAKEGSQTLSEPKTINPNGLYLAGDWMFSPEYAESKSNHTKIIFRYRAKNVYLVASSEQGVSATVLIDGKPIGNRAGPDAPLGKPNIKEDRLYHLIADPAGYGKHTVEIIIESPGMKAFTFTFG